MLTARELLDFEVQENIRMDVERFAKLHGKTKEFAETKPVHFHDKSLFGEDEE